VDVAPVGAQPPGRSRANGCERWLPWQGWAVKTHVHGVFDNGHLDPAAVRAVLRRLQVHDLCRPDACSGVSGRRQPRRLLGRRPIKKGGARESWFGTQRGHLRASRWAHGSVDALGNGEQEAVVEGAAILGKKTTTQDMNYGQAPTLAGGLWAAREAEGRGPSRDPQSPGQCRSSGGKEHLPRMGGTVERMGRADLWEDFWRWREECDVNAFRERQQGEYQRSFRGEKKARGSDAEGKPAA